MTEVEKVREALRRFQLRSVVDGLLQDQFHLRNVILLLCGNEEQVAEGRRQAAAIFEELEGGQGRPPCPQCGQALPEECYELWKR